MASESEQTPETDDDGPEAQARIVSVTATGLVGRKTPVKLELADDHPVFLTGGSGTGKSTLLRAIHAVATGDLPVLATLPLEELRLAREGAEDIRVTKRVDRLDVAIGDKRFTHKPGDVPAPSPEELYMGSAAPRLLRMDGAVTTRVDYDALRSYFASHVSIRAPWLVSELAGLSVPYIADDRLFALADQDVPSPVEAGTLGRAGMPYRPVDGGRLSYRSIDQINIGLREIYRTRTIRASRQLQRIDRDLPQRVISAVRGPEAKLEMVEACLDEIQTLETRLSQFGLAGQDHGVATALLEGGAVPTGAQQGELAVLLAVLQAYLDKLEASKSILDDLERFIGAVNRRFRGKHLEFTPRRGLRVYLDVTDQLAPFRNEDGSIPLSALSSGEQHLVVLLYRLVFGASRRSLFLVDEPEISLHVAWQRELASDLAEIAFHTESRYLIATHSPAVIAGHLEWEVNFDDLAEE